MPFKKRGNEGPHVKLREGQEVRFFGKDGIQYIAIHGSIEVTLSDVTESAFQLRGLGGRPLQFQCQMALGDNTPFSERLRWVDQPYEIVARDGRQWTLPVRKP